MKQYIHIFKNNDDYEDFVYGLAYKEPFVSNTKIKEETSLKDSYRLNYNLTKLEKERKNFLTFDIEGDGDIFWKSESSAFTKTISYKKNDDDWIQITSTADENPPTISVVTGDKIQFKGNGGYYNSGKVSFDGTTCQFNLHGNILSLYNEDETVFPFLSGATVTWTFRGMFEGITGLTDASLLYMSNGKTPYGIYYRLFKNCSSLKYAPELPATTIDGHCYDEMFYGCTSLTTAPALPATTLAPGCYRSLYSQCILLTTAPDLLAPILVTECYQEMFDGATNVNYIKCLATNVTGSTYTSNWVRNVQTSSGTFVKHSSTSWSSGNNGIPNNWTEQDN